MYSDWAAAAHRAIDTVTASLPEGVNLAERKRALREAGPNFHAYTSWGRKIWGRECRKHLELHGQPSRVSAPLFAADITFPFRTTLQPEEQ